MLENEHKYTRKTFFFLGKAQGLKPHKWSQGWVTPPFIIKHFFLYYLSEMLAPLSQPHSSSIPDIEFKCFGGSSRCGKTIKVLGLLLPRWSAWTHFSPGPSVTLWVIEGICLFLPVMNRKRKLGLETENLHYNFPSSEFSLEWNKISLIKHKWKTFAPSVILMV